VRHVRILEEKQIICLDYYDFYYNFFINSCDAPHRYISRSVTYMDGKKKLSYNI
jgi:hypothetical protein